MSNIFGIKNLPYKMVKMYDTAGKEGLMLKEKMPKNVNKRSAFIIRLESNENASETYRPTEDLFLEIKEKIKPYRSLGIKAKRVRCIETGEIFRCAKQAANWLKKMRLTYSYNADSIVKDACKGKKETAYGYHWEFVE